MSLLYVCGDIHFSAMNEWSLCIGEKFLNWFENIDIPPGSELIQLGDVVEVAVNPGKVIDQMYLWSELCEKKFAHTYILQGNHDIKFWKGKEQSALEFLNSKDNCTVISKPQIFDTYNGFSVVALPHITTYGIDLNKYLMTQLDKAFYETKADLLVAHTNIREPGNTFLDSGIELEKFSAKNFVLGHIHTRLRSEYTGSVWPNKINEEASPFPRLIKCFEKQNDDCIEKNFKSIDIPKFVEYAELDYPNKPVKDNDLIKIYTINNCGNLQFAKSHYPDLFIRGINKAKVIDSTGTVKSESTFKIEKPIDALKSYITETKTTLSRGLYSYLVNLLK